MCFSSGSSKAPKPQQPNRFEYVPPGENSVARQAATYEAKGYTNTASYGSELGSGGAAPAAPSASPALTVAGG
jgi:hypothetical protein